MRDPYFNNADYEWRAAKPQPKPPAPPPTPEERLLRAIFGSDHEADDHEEPMP